MLRSSRKLRGRFAVIHVLQGRAGASRFGVALTKRLVPDAVDRNRVKRVAREAFRRHSCKGAGLDCVLTLREKIAGIDDDALAAEFASLLDRVASAEPR